MASTHRDPKSGVYRVMFRYGGKQFQKSLKTTDGAEAERLRGKIETTLLELERGRKALPEGADLWEFVKSDGQRVRKAQAPTVVTLDALFDRYEKEMPAGTMEANSLATILIHKKHLLRVLGGRTDVRGLSTADVQRYVNARAKEKYHGKLISPRTIKKEATTLRSVWNWGKEYGIVPGDAPTKGLRYEKEAEAIGFLTWEEIELRVRRGGVSAEEAAELWDALFLSNEQTGECLDHVMAADVAPFVYPMFVFVAHTGARRSEMMRSRVEDFDFEAKRVCLREKKKNKKVKETRRYVDMTLRLEKVMREWLGKHPGGPYTFCQGVEVARSRKRSKTTGHQSGPGRAKTKAGRQATVRSRTERPGPSPLTAGEATHHFRRALAGSKWSVVRGFHVFRHSFASNLARAKFQPGAIDQMMGHQTEEMRKRYHHLFPEETRGALHKVYGE